MSLAGAERSPRGVWWLVPVAVLAAFWPSLNAGLVYDDWLNFDRNQALRDRDWWTLVTSAYYGHDTTYWRPMTSLLMAIAYQAGPPGVHALAILLHLLSTLTLGAIARQLFGEEHLAVFVALLFALHPVQVESVAWASALPSVLSGLFVLLVVRSAVTWSMSNSARERRPPWSAVLWLLLALLAKESAVMALPLLAIAVRSRRPRPSGPARSLLLVATVVCAAWFAARVAIVGHRPVLGEGWAWLAGAAQMIVRQVALLVWPWPLTPLRPPPYEVGSAALDAIAAMTVVVALVVAAVAWRRFSPRWRVTGALVSVPLLLAAVTYDAVGPHPLTDRYLYVSVSGFSLAIVAVARRSRAALGVLILVYGVVASVQCRVWQDDRTFAEHVRAVSPRDAAACVLAGGLALRGANAPALVVARHEYQTALDLLPRRTDPFARRQRAAALAGLAWCDFHDVTTPVPLGPRLIENFRAALAQDPGYVPAWVGLGVALGLNGQHAEAVTAFDQALAIDPLCPEAWFNLAQTQIRLGRRAEARDSLAQALRCDPGLTAATDLLASVR